MRFTEQNKVIIDSMNAVEAKAFILFLKSEIARRKMDIAMLRDLIYEVCLKFKLADILEE